MKILEQIIIISCLILLFNSSLFAQEEEKELKLSLQTDLLAYTTSGGWSLWGMAQHKQNRLALAFINYPNRGKDTYEETGIKENIRFARLQLARHFKPTSKMKNFFYGINIEHHWRELEEDNNPDEILNDTNWQGGLFVGFDWYPWSKKENALQNISIIPWVGGNYVFNSGEQARVFENTGNVHDIPNFIRRTLGLNISYTFFKN